MRPHLPLHLVSRRLRPARCWLVVLSTLLLLVAAAPSKAADDAAAFFKGKTVHLVVGYGAGGGYDTYARMIAPYLEKRLGVTVVVDNRPGAGGVVALNQVFLAEPDGLTIMLVNGTGAVLGQLTEAAGVRYDLTRMSWLGRVVSEDRVLFVSEKSPYRSIDDLRRSDRPIKFAAGGKIDSISDLEAITCKALDLNCKIIIGYKGSKGAALAVIRGEADGLTTTASSSHAYARDGGLVFLAALGRGRADLFDDLPTIFEQIDLTPDQAWWIDLHETIRAVGRSFVAPPDLPEARLKALRDAVTAVLADPAFVAEAAKRKRLLAPVPAEQVQDFVAKTLASLAPNRLEEVRKVLLETYF